ncbi:MAG: hypothetical protein ACYC96_08650 [Fimbriimonadaceae bacterium]
MIYAEVSIRYSTIEDLERALPLSLLEREEFPSQAAFVAGKCYFE